MLAIICEFFTTTCPKNPNSIQNASVLTNSLSDVLNLQTEKLPGDLLFVVGFQFRYEFLLLTKMRSSNRRIRSRLSISKRSKSRKCCTTFTKVRALEETFHSRFAVLALNVHGLRIRSKSWFSPGG
jgi:hypothetical protein